MKLRFLAEAAVGALILVSCQAPVATPSSSTTEVLFVAWAASSAQFISSYVIDPKTGTLTEAPGSPYPAGASPGVPGPMTVARGQMLYMVDNNNMWGYYVNGLTGALTPLPGSPFLSGLTPRKVATDATGALMLFTNNSPTIGSLATAPFTGGVTVVSTVTPPGFAAIDTLTSDPVGPYVYITDNTTIVNGFIVDPATGALSSNAAASPGNSNVNPTSGAAMDPKGRFLYYADGAGNVEAYSISPSTGGLTLSFQRSAFDQSPVTMAIDSTGRFLYTENGSTATMSAYAINSSTGALTAIGSPVAVPPSAGITVKPAVDPSGAYLFATEEGPTFFRYSLDPSTGAITSAQPVVTSIPNAANVTAMSIDAITVP